MDRGALTYLAYRLGGELAPLVPAPLGHRLSELAGLAIYRLSAARHNVEGNIAHVVGRPAGSSEVRRIARKVFQNQCKNYFDLLRVASLSPETIRHTVRELQGIEHLNKALAHGRGVVLASAHFGNIDVAGQILALLGYRVTAIAEHLKPERLFQYIRRQRESHGLSFIPINGPLRPVFRALRQNEIVGSAMDHNVTGEGRLVEFCGHPARLPDGYLRLALRTEAVLLVCFCRRLPDNSFAVTVEPEVELERSGDLERDTVANLPKALAILEIYLRRYPEQWVLFQPLWQGVGSR